MFPESATDLPLAKEEQLDSLSLTEQWTAWSEVLDVGEEIAVEGVNAS